MISVIKIMEGIYFIRQNNPIHPLSTSNGFLITPSAIKDGNNTDFRDSLLLDVNIEEVGWISLRNFCFDSDIPLPTKLIMSHCHLDHSSHVHLFVEIFGGQVYAPTPELPVILEENGFFEVYQIHEINEFPDLLDSYHHLKYEILQFGTIPERKGTPYHIGTVFNYDTIKIETIPLTSHSPGHVGFRIDIPHNEIRIFHNSCLGLDQSNNESKDGGPKDGFGPWYGFKASEINSYLKDIDKSEEILQDCDILTSSHGIIYYKSRFKMKQIHGKTDFVRTLDESGEIESPFEYMRRKIHERENKIVAALEKLGFQKTDIPNILKSEQTTRNLLDMDLIFSKYRIPSKQLVAYKFWERYLIINHLKHLNTQ
ncbi:MAG: hypothetical protein ACTSRE_13050 [Promethearchaeota archaeon]